MKVRPQNRIWPTGDTAFPVDWVQHQLRLERDDARIEALLWKIIAWCSWGVVVVLMVT